MTSSYGGWQQLWPFQFQKKWAMNVTRTSSKEADINGWYFYYFIITVEYSGENSIYYYGLYNVNNMDLNPEPIALSHRETNAHDRISRSLQMRKTWCARRNVIRRIFLKQKHMYLMVLENWRYASSGKCWWGVCSTFVFILH